jgi:hypothetical protein
MALDLNNTYLLLQALEQSYPPQTLFRDTFFPNTVTFPTKSVLMDYRKGSRVLAPFVSNGSGSVNVDRNGFHTKEYEPPMMAPSRLITVQHIDKRGFGEAMFSTQTPEQRALALRAQDMAELQDMTTRTIEWMCAQLMIYGEFEVSGYAEDGKNKIQDTVTYADWTQKATMSGNDKWDTADSNGAYTADIYDQIKTVAQTVSRNSGRVPNIALGSWKTCQYLLKNKSMLDILMIPSRDNVALMQFQPKITSPGVIRYGYLSELNLDIYAYDGVYDDGSGTLQQYLPDGYFIVANSGRGSQLFGSITQLEDDGEFRTYEGKTVPKIWKDTGADSLKIRVASKCVPKPEFIDDWYTIKAF